jgi:hypothetical protein
LFTFKKIAKEKSWQLTCAKQWILIRNLIEQKRLSRQLLVKKSDGIGYAME